MILPIKHELFYYEHLLSNKENLALIKNFKTTEQTGFGLENYLKNIALYEENNKLNNTYLVKDKVTNELVGFFSLRNGLFTLYDESSEIDSIPAIELSNFAVNSNYRKNHPETKAIGKTIFSEFVLPIVDFVSSIVAVHAIYIYALPEEKLIEHYKSMGFNRLDPEEEAFVHSHVKPTYDEGCFFMYQSL